MCSSAGSGAFEFGATKRSQTAYTRLPFASVGSAVRLSLSLKLLASGTPVRELSARSTNGSLHVAVLWRMREASTALRGVVRSTPIAIDHRSPLGAHETQGSEERP